MTRDRDEFPPYAFVPGGPHPHPTGSPDGHSAGRGHEILLPIDEDAWEQSAAYLRGFALFQAGYYWEAHEVWEGLWHAHGRRGAIADMMKGLIKLAAAGVKVRQGQPHGITTHAKRAAAAFEAARREAGESLLGFRLDDLIGIARSIAANPPTMSQRNTEEVVKAFDFKLMPSR